MQILHACIQGIPPYPDTDVLGAPVAFLEMVLETMLTSLHTIFPGPVLVVRTDETRCLVGQMLSDNLMLNWTLMVFLRRHLFDMRRM